MEPELPCPCADARAADQSHATMACEPGTGKNGNIILLTLGRGIKADMAVRPTYYANVGGTLFMAQLLFFPTHSHPTHKLTQYILVRMIRPLAWKEVRQAKLIYDCNEPLSTNNKTSRDARQRCLLAFTIESLGKERGLTN